MAKETYYGEINFERVGDGRMVHIDFLLHDTLGLMGTESLPAGADGESADGKKLVVLIKTAPERLTVYDVQVHISTQNTRDGWDTIVMRCGEKSIFCTKESGMEMLVQLLTHGAQAREPMSREELTKSRPLL